MASISRRRSSGLDRSKAIRAIDRPVHPGLERNLCLIAAGRAKDREVLTLATLVTSFVATRPADVTRVVPATIPIRTATRSAGGAPLRVAHEPLLDVKLLVSGRMGELHPAIHAGEGTIDVRHDVLPPGGAKISAGDQNEAPARWSRHTGRIQRAADSGRPSAETTGHIDTVPVTMLLDILVSERGVMGAPRSLHIPSRDTRRAWTTGWDDLTETAREAGHTTGC